MVNTVTIEEYQAFVETTWATAKTPAEKELRLFLGMMGELGEIAEKTKKYLRDGGDPDKYRKEIILEFGDFFYYFAMYANFLDIDLNEVLSENVLKLMSRHERGVVKGSGDNR